MVQKSDMMMRKIVQEFEGGIGKLFIGIKKQQKVGIKLHNMIQLGVINMEMVLKKMKLKHLNGIKNRLNRNIMMHKINLDIFMIMVQV